MSLKKPIQGDDHYDHDDDVHRETIIPFHADQPCSERIMIKLPYHDFSHNAQSLLATIPGEDEDLSKMPMIFNFKWYNEKINATYIYNCTMPLQFIKRE